MEALQYDPKIPCSIWRHDVWVASTNCESGGELDDRASLAKEMVRRYNAHEGLVKALKVSRRYVVSHSPAALTSEERQIDAALRGAGETI